MESLIFQNNAKFCICVCVLSIPRTHPVFTFGNRICLVVVCKQFSPSILLLRERNFIKWRVYQIPDVLFQLTVLRRTWNFSLIVLKMGLRFQGLILFFSPSSCILTSTSFLWYRTHFSFLISNLNERFFQFFCNLRTLGSLAGSYWKCPQLVMNSFRNLSLSLVLIAC